MRKPVAFLLASFAAAVLIVSCGGSGTTQNDDAKNKPGDTTSAKAAFGDADVEFAQGMIPHHRQAVEMAELAPTRAQSPQVKELAAQIKRAQDPEIKTMSGWLRSWGEEVPEDTGDTGMDHGGMDMGEDMPGMMSGEQMADLEAAKGAAFDRMFMELMIDHHEGAIEMAETEQRDGENTAAKKLAATIEKAQTAEIAQMRKLLANSG
ncbi:DUF305 domain-containing protein [Actinopolymorpha sp. B17G11]|uniref:DUF305 domain-containing protein n=1 Tax=Actinopolymorpha sp. B17G11 TaxID=3160861 RepID=UPI0032E4B7BF